MLVLPSIAAAAAIVTSIGTDPASNENEALANPNEAVQLCAASEQQIFYGSSTTDEFGYAIAVCEGPAELGEAGPVAIILSGEGGNLRTDCKADECSAVIQFCRYTRYRFTHLTLTWRDKYAEHKLVETFDAQDMEAGPFHSLTHFWGADADGESLSTPSEPLLLMRVEKGLLAD